MSGPFNLGMTNLEGIILGFGLLCGIIFISYWVLVIGMTVEIVSGGYDFLKAWVSDRR